MKKVLIPFILLLILSTTVKAQTVEPLTNDQFKEKIWNYDKDKEWKYLGNKPAIIDLYATWCGPCKRLAPILAEIQKDYGNKLQIYKVDTDKEKQLAQLFNVSSIPLMVFIPLKGKPFLVTGLRPKEDLVKIINETLLSNSETTASSL
ncbi:thioredoxin domain-containing protein [uncultured Odoribacter sp.]|uniref:thioredoxin family protein n=1 Tax=uncultured Odoribacter sp. TaxID=876416 RepID=UPI002613F64E|nr:thioredoxin domain-containing protein [uncultured Odoribacter sp.]